MPGKTWTPGRARSSRSCATCSAGCFASSPPGTCWYSCSASSRRLLGQNAYGAGAHGTLPRGIKAGWAVHISGNRINSYIFCHLDARSPSWALGLATMPSIRSGRVKQRLRRKSQRVVVGLARRGPQRASAHRQTQGGCKALVPLCSLWPLPDKGSASDHTLDARARAFK